jgi:hypothetical protein
MPLLSNSPRRRPPGARAREFCTSVRPMFESLEHRMLLSGSASPAVDATAAATTGPRIVAVHVIGPPTDATGVVVTFDEAMDPATAQDKASYVLVKHINTDSKDNGGGFFDIPFTDTTTPAKSDLVRIHFSSAVYDDATHSVTLTPKHTFEIRRRFRILRVAGKGDHTITDAAGMALDGNYDGVPGGNAALKYKSHRGQYVNIKDVDGDRLKLHLSGPGQILLTQRRRNPDPNGPLVFLIGTNANHSTLSGQVKISKKGGDGIVPLAELTGISAAQVNILNDPSIPIGMTQP